MASKIAIVIEREYRTRVMKKSFILITLLTPLFFVLISVLPALLMNVSSDKQHVGIIDRTGMYASQFKNTDQYTFVDTEQSLSDFKEDKESEFTAFLEIRQDLLEDPKALTLYSHKTLPSGLEDYINKTLSNYLSDQKLAQSDIPNIKAIIRESKVNVQVATYRVGDDGAETMTSGDFSAVLGSVMSLAIYMFISIYGAMVLQGVMEEKKSRIMEVMVSSVRPFDLMMGKIIGIGLVGITQILIWIVLLIGLSIGAQFFFLGELYDPETMAAASQAANVDTREYYEMFHAMQSVNFVEVGVLFLLYFIGGFLLYAAIYAGLGSAVSSDEDSAQLMMPMTILMLASFYIGFACIQNPETPMAIWCSYIPFTSPLVMLVRLPYGVALWEQILSLVILYGSFVGMTFVSGKIYRIGVLMYGKKPSLRDIWRWLRYY